MKKKYSFLKSCPTLDQLDMFDDLDVREYVRLYFPDMNNRCVHFRKDKFSYDEIVDEEHLPF